jgi:hypothetical protein
MDFAPLIAVWLEKKGVKKTRLDQPSSPLLSLLPSFGNLSTRFHSDVLPGLVLKSVKTKGRSNAELGNFAHKKGQEPKTGDSKGALTILHP